MGLVLLGSSLGSKSRVPSAVPEEKDSYPYTFNKEHRIHHPADYRPAGPDTRSFSSGGMDVHLFAERFSQGRAVYAEVTHNGQGGKKVSGVRLVFDGVEAPVTQRDWGHRAVFAIPPEAAPGKKELALHWKNGFRHEKAVFELEIEPHQFPYSRHAMDLGRFSDVGYHEKPEVLAFIKECSEKKRRAFGSREPDLIEDSLAHPRDLHYITSEFWAKRTIAQHKWKDGKKVQLKSRTRVHSGVDFRGKKGRPVYAMAHGKIVLADLLHYEGNMVIIDHGNEVFSYYMHLDGFRVNEGDSVQAGQLIGHVGDSGISTAPHLHVSLLIRGVQVDPLSVLSLPIR
jgi:hypothetical protein